MVIFLALLCSCSTLALLLARCSCYALGSLLLLCLAHCSADFDAQRQRQVQVIMPPPPQNEAVANEAGATGSSAAETASSAAPDGQSIVEKAIAELPPNLAEMAKDPKRKAKSRDPGWKYGFWPDPLKKEMVQCIFCKKVVPAGIKRFKQHLAGGYGDTIKCPKAPELISKEMSIYLKKNARSVIVQVDEGEGEGEQEQEQGAEEGEAVDQVAVPSSGTRLKQAKAAKLKVSQAAITSFMVSGPVKPQTQKYSKSISSMLCDTPEEVVAKRHKYGTSQPTLEHCTKKSKEAKEIVDDHVADFFYENAIAFNVINSRSFEIMVESIGQYGPGYRAPTFREIREELLERVVQRTMELRKKHEEAWKEYALLVACCPGLVVFFLNFELLAHLL